MEYFCIYVFCELCKLSSMMGVKFYVDCSSLIFVFVSIYKCMPEFWIPIMETEAKVFVVLAQALKLKYISHALLVQVLSNF